MFRHRMPPAVALSAGLSIVIGALSAPATAASDAVTTAGAGIRPPVAKGALHLTGTLRDGGTVAARGLRWRPGRVPAGDRLLSFEVGYVWKACRAGHCRAGADSTASPFAADRYIAGHGDIGRHLRLTETATEVVQTTAANFTFRVLRARRSVTTSALVAPFRRGHRPTTEFVNGLPERMTGSAEEYFQVDAPHYAAADGHAGQRFRIDRGPWRAMPSRRVFYTGHLRPGPHRVSVATFDRAGRTVLSFRWHVVPLAAPEPCRGSCWYPPARRPTHLNSAGKPMRWDWQIGRTFPLERTGKRAVDFYDIDGFLTTKAEVHQIKTRWQASTLAHPRTACYLDLAWEDYRPDASPSPRGLFPAGALGRVYYGYPQERWVDFRQLDALKPMLRERISMCARKGFDAVELDDIDSFDPPSTTGFYLTPGDAQNYLAYAFNLVHADGMTALWKNNPRLAKWGARYTDGAVVEECYAYKQCAAWHVFTADKTAAQPTGKWVGEAEYGSDHYVCNPGKHCPGRHSFAAFCRHVYDGPDGFAAVKFDVDLNGRVFLPCPRGR
jgi:Glycoside-hydrolase family GH114